MTDNSKLHFVFCPFCDTIRGPPSTLPMSNCSRAGVAEASEEKVSVEGIYLMCTAFLKSFDASRGSMGIQLSYPLNTSY